MCSRKTSEAQLRRALLSPGVRRDDMLASHPFMTDKQRLITPAVKLMFEHAQECLNYGIAGFAAEAHSRHGKTTAKEIVEDRLLPQSQPDVVVVTIEAVEIENAARSQTEFLLDWLVDFKYPISARASKSMAKDAVLTYLRTRGTSWLLLVIEEAQNYGVEQWKVIKALTNSLARKNNGGIRTVVLSIFQGSADPVVSELKLTKPDIATRFFLRRVWLRGVQSLGDLKEHLKLFDDVEQEEFPEGSNISYSEALLPEAFAAGWRLAHEAEAAWSAMVASWPKNVPVIDVGMGALVDVLRRFFRANLETAQAGFSGDVETWTKLIENSSFISYAENSLRTWNQ